MRSLGALLINTSQLKKESGISNRQRVSAGQGVRVSNDKGSQVKKRRQGSLLINGSQPNKESRVPIQQGVSAD